MSPLYTLGRAEIAELITAHRRLGEIDLESWPYAEALALRERYYGRRVFLRGLIEYTSYCRQDCYYCGLRRGNLQAQRYRLEEGQIVSCCEMGYELGFRTFVLQGGEDAAWTVKRLCRLVDVIKQRWPDCAVTLSLGELPGEDYRALRAAGADRYLLRHETADAAHYATLHPAGQGLESRKRCLWALKEAGFQVGAGFMVGSPGQTPQHLAADLLFLRELQPDMVGVGPFIPHKDTPFARYPAGTLNDTLMMLALTRLLLPRALMPSTTALSTIHPCGREMGFQVGANVAMPNLSPVDVRKAYSLYDGKAAFGAESAQGLALLSERVAAVGFAVDMGRGDPVGREVMR